jgi:hypothetical protein
VICFVPPSILAVLDVCSKSSGGSAPLLKALRTAASVAPGLYGAAIRWCGSLPAFENSIVFLPALSPDALKPYSKASTFVGAVGSPPPPTSPSTSNDAMPNFRPWP